MRGESIWYLRQREQCGPGFREEATGVSSYFLQWWEVGESRQSFSCNWLHAGLEDPGVYPGDEKTVRGFAPLHLILLHNKCAPLLRF